MVDEQEETLKVMEEAIRAHISADTGGDLVTDWMLVTAAVD